MVIEGTTDSTLAYGLMMQMSLVALLGSVIVTSSTCDVQTRVGTGENAVCGAIRLTPKRGVGQQHKMVGKTLRATTDAQLR